MKKTIILSLLFLQLSIFAQNNVHMYPYIDNSGRDVCLTWKTNEGKSVFYSWNSGISNWKAYSINLPEKPVEGATGEIMMVPYIDNSGRDVCLAWDTKTGKSVFYSWNSGISNWKAYSINLPEKPVEGATGEIMMYPYIDNSGRDVCLAWDKSTGKSVFYSWNSGISNWKAYSINLPEKPVEGATGEIMMVPYIDNSGRDVCLAWDTKTGKSVFYSWNSGISNWKAYSINLPEKPVEGATGEIMMVPYIDNSGRDVCLAWDIKTGKSVFYSWNSGISNWKAYSINLPEKPVEGATGSIGMVPYIDNSGRDVCLAWDISTGKSVFYSWNSGISNWKAYSINLPEKPVE